MSNNILTNNAVSELTVLLILVKIKIQSKQFPNIKYF